MFLGITNKKWSSILLLTVVILISLSFGKHVDKRMEQFSLMDISNAITGRNPNPKVGASPTPTVSPSSSPTPTASPSSSPSQPEKPVIKSNPAANVKSSNSIVADNTYKTYNADTKPTPSITLAKKLKNDAIFDTRFNIENEGFSCISDF
jgi:hypothetical protein